MPGMTREQWEEKITNLGYVLTGEQEIAPDRRNGVTHVREVLHQIDEYGGVLLRKIGFYRDVGGVFGEADLIYPDFKWGDIPSDLAFRKEFGLPVSTSDQEAIDAAIASARERPDVLSVGRVVEVDGGVVVTAVVLAGGAATEKQFFVNAEGIYPYTPMTLAM